MSGLDELRQRVEAAEGHFGMIAAQSETYSARLTGLMTRMERAHADQQREIALLTDQVDRAETENRELRRMLFGLLQAIESGDSGGVGDVVRDLERRIDTMVGGTSPAEEGEAPTEAQEQVPGERKIGDLDVPMADDAGSADDEEAVADAGAEMSDDALEDAEPVEVALELAPAHDAADLSAIAVGPDEADEAEAEGLAEAEDDLAALLAGMTDDAPDAGDLADLAEENVTAENPPRAKPTRETIALDDTVGSEEHATRGATPADELLSRVDAVANALMAGGIELDQDDEDLTVEISALLQDAIGAKRAQLRAQAGSAEPTSDETDVAIEDWADAGETDGADEIEFEQDAA